MSVYETGVAAYRDTTKWLVAFLPVTAVVGAALVSGRPLITSVRAAPSVGDWLAEHWLVLVCGIVVFTAIAVVLWAGARVLSVEPTDIGELSKPEMAPELAKAIGAGVAAPEFFDKASFDTAMAELANAWDTESGVPSDDPRLSRLRGPIEALRLWSLLQRVRTPYRDFRLVFVLSSIVITAAVIIMPAQLSQSAVVDKPTAVNVEVDTEGAADLEAVTGCIDPSRTTFTAVAGTWESPELATDGPECTFGATWRPSAAQFELRLAPPADQ